MSCVEKRHMSHRVGSMLHHRFPNGFTDLFMDDTDREVSTLTDRAFRSLCVGDDAVYNDEFLYGYSPFSCHKPLVGEPLKKTHHKESKKQGQNKTDKNYTQPWNQQQQKNLSHMSSFLKAFSAAEESCDGMLIKNGGMTDIKGESWDKSALRSIQRELSEFSSDYPANLTDGHYENCHRHHSGDGPTNKAGKDVALPSGKSSKTKNGKSTVKLRKLNIKNFFLHSELSPFQTWRDFNRFPFGQQDTVLPTDSIPKWYDLPFYKELTEAHRQDTQHAEEVQPCQKAAVEHLPSTAPKPIPPPPPPKVLPKPSAAPAEKRCSSDQGDGSAAPWRRNRSRATSVIPVNQSGIPPPDNCLKFMDESLFLVKKEARSVEVKAVEEVSSLASTPFSICQLMTPLIPSRQPTETSEILQAVLSPSALDLPLRPHSEAKLTPEPPIKRDSYKSLASSILFNLKDNRKRQRNSVDQLTNGDSENTKLENELVRKQAKLKHVFSARQNNYIKYQRYTDTDDEQGEEFEEGDLKVNTRMEADEETVSPQERRDSEHIINDLQALKELERARLGDRSHDNTKNKLGVISIEEEARAKNDLISRELRNIKKGMMSMRGNTTAKRDLFAKKEKEQIKPEAFTKIDNNVIVNKALINDNYDKAKMALEEIISERGITPIPDEIFKPKEISPNTSPAMLLSPSILQTGNKQKPQFGEFLTVPQEEDRFSGVSPSSEGVESITTSAADTADEMGMNDGLLVERDVSKVPSERSGSTCSGNESQTGLPKPPAVLPKSEKAVLKAIKLATRRMKKEEAQKSSHKSSQGSGKHRADRHRSDKSEHKSSSSSRSSKSSERKHREKTEEGQNHSEIHQGKNSNDSSELSLNERRGHSSEINHQQLNRQQSRRQSHDSVESNNQNNEPRPSVATERQGRSNNRHVREKTQQRHYSSDRVISNVPVYKAYVGDRPTPDRPFQRSQSSDRCLGDKVERRLSTDMSVNERLDPRSQRIEKSIMDELQQRGRARDKTSRDNPFRRSHSIDAYSTEVPHPSTLSRQSSHTSHTSHTSQLSRQSSIEHAIVTQSFPMTQRKLLQDPDSGQYFFVDMPVQVKTKTFFDPETGSYVQLPVQPPEGAVPQASPLEVLTPPLVVYHGFVPVPLSPMAQKATIQAPHMAPEEFDQRHLERSRQMHCKERHPYLEPVYGQHDLMLGEFLGTEELDCPS
uniref:cardiac-enriched FHL2-interacting protein n=1 Tax=Semicossyphus pulcher TaxID=241346 RepID=UPI0037E87BA1